MISAMAGDAMLQLAEEVRDELAESYPEELNRTSLRDIRGMRTDPRERAQLKKIAVRKFPHLTPMQRYERAQLHARLLPCALRMMDLMLVEHLAALHSDAHNVRSPLMTSHCTACTLDQRNSFGFAVWRAEDCCCCGYKQQMQHASTCT